MPRTLQPNTAEQLFPSRMEGAPALATIICQLVGYTVEQVERELILSSLAHYCGNRTWTANGLGISIRTLRNKINEYTAQGVTVPRAQNVTTQASLQQHSNSRSEEPRSVQDRPS
jgi:two-component system, response regulator FlrC